MNLIRSRSGNNDGYRLLAGALSLTLGVLPAVAPAPAEAAADIATHTIRIDGADTGRTFDGVGGVSAGGSSRLLLDYPVRERDEILDYLFRPNYGAALDILKVEIGGDVDATVGAEPSHMRTPDQVDCARGYEWWLMSEARERNADIRFYGLPWGAPGWFDGGYWSGDRVEYLVTWLQCARQNGFHIDYLGAANESGFNRDVYVELGRALDAAGFGDVQIVATDNHSPPDYWFAAPQIAADAELDEAIDILGEHDVCVWRTQQQRCYASESALATGKPLWDSENSTQDYDVGAQPLARAMNRHYIDARITGNLNWALVSAWYDNFPIGGTGLMLAERPWSGSYEVGPSIWVDAHTAQFTEPGWRYLDDAAGYSGAGASHVALRASGGDDYTAVIETLDSSGPERLRFEVSGGLASTAVSVWVTDLTTASTADDFIRQGSVEPVDGSYDLVVEPGRLYTVSTTTGQAKGSAAADADPGSQLAVPYAEDFEGVRRGGAGDADVARRGLGLARYFADVHGAFEAVPCVGGRDGTCYEQQVTHPPLSWHNTNMPPTTMVGDPRWWGDYEVSVDALLDQAGHVELLGRVDSQQHNAAGYHLRVADSGDWSLFTQDVRSRDRTLATGQVPALGTGRWHRLGLRFKGERVTALLDGRVLATVQDADHTTGQVGLRVGGWQRAQFDNLRVVPTGPRPAFYPHSAMSATATSEHTANDFGHHYPARHAIDDHLWSTWRSSFAPIEPLPQALTLDLGRVTTVAGLAYTPAVTATAGGITHYTVSTSKDGRKFTDAVHGYWADTLATKTAPLPTPVRARYVRLAAVDVNGCPAAAMAAEVNVSRTRLPRLGAGEPPTDPGPSFPHLVPQSAMTATATSQQPGYEAGRAIDGNCATMWHESWSPYTPPPQSVTLDLGADYDTLALVYQPRQDGNANGIVTEYEIALSTDGSAFTTVAEGTWAGDDTTKVAGWEATRTRYVRLTAQAGVSGHVSAAEINIAHTG
ncbi:discoidin domain-containing protein [Plantactinospora sp. B6F1]|uniref:discoidin domain-containing protein n=1 Tax=Plantactinospora sp. B6F1 TaxID=3158971 RepID=UPI0032D8C129